MGLRFLQISSYWDSKHTDQIDLAPGTRSAAELTNARLTATLQVGKRCSGKCCRAVSRTDGWKCIRRPAIPIARLPKPNAICMRGKCSPRAPKGYGKAEVTAGGVDTAELSAKTMESRKVPGLFFIGEVVDVTGQLGGFNFQWAWASGYCAGQAV